MPPPGAGLHRIRARTRITLALLLYGLVLSVWSAARFNAAIPDSALLMGARIDGVRYSLQTLKEGGPPLLACKRGYTPETKTTCVPVGWTDDQGLYLYLPYLALWTGVHDPPRVLKGFFIGSFSVLIGVYPLTMWALFGSALAGLVLPLAVALKFTYVQNTDIYWIGSWCLLLCLPLLLIVHDRWRARSPLALIGIVIVASFASSIRLHTGLPILMGALVVLLFRHSSWLRTLTWAGVVVLAYLSVHPFGLQAVRTYRDHVVGDASLSAHRPTSHPIWHNMYIGLGYRPNRYGITWNDSVAYATVKRLSPRARFVSAEYERTLRDEYFRIAREDPRLVIDNLTSKLEVIVKEAATRIGALVLLIPLSLFVGSATHTMRRYLLVVAPAVALGAVPPLLTLPYLGYQMSWLGAWAFLWLLAAGWLLTTVPRDILRRLETRRPPGPAEEPPSCGDPARREPSRAG